MSGQDGLPVAGSPEGTASAERADGGSEGDAAPSRRRGHRRAVRPGTEREPIAGVSSDETPTGWSDAAGGGAGGSGDANDDRLRQDVPPHW